MLKIYLVRHGQDQDNIRGILNGHRDMPLTNKGIEQALEVASKIKQSNIKFDYIYTSPLKRAISTAEIISNTIHCSKPQLCQYLIERDFGIMTGERIENIEKMCAPNVIKTETITYFLNPEGAETFPNLVDRARKILNKIKTTHTEGEILLVTHGDIGKMIYAAYYELHWKEVLELFHFGNSEMLVLSPDTQAGEAHIFRIIQHNH